MALSKIVGASAQLDLEAAVLYVKSPRLLAEATVHTSSARIVKNGASFGTISALKAITLRAVACVRLTAHMVWLTWANNVRK